MRSRLIAEARIERRWGQIQGFVSITVNPTVIGQHAAPRAFGVEGAASSSGSLRHDTGLIVQLSAQLVEDGPCVL
jgi:hypothetical protein